ncbi:MAG: efflux RND transporter periplasmic adaptor subunit [Actinomycetota bacterium]|nr:efflux RND transporter periplasmic adaptor subunit [Actinomycetota bacterium]
MHPEDEKHERLGRAGLLADRAGAFTLEPPQVAAFNRGQPRPRLVRDPPPPAPPVGQYAIRLARTWPQRCGGILIAAAMAAAAVWYIPSVLDDNRRLLTGTVASSGVITLNFSSAGVIAAISAVVNKPVRKGQVLAREYAPESASVVTADKAAIAADDAKIAQVKTIEAADPANAAVENAQLLAAQAQLDLDQAQLATDRTKITTTEIIAPSSGVIVAANGQPGQTVTASGIRDYVTDSQEQSAAEGPAFSLLPEGPQTVRRISASASAVPVVALRTSDNWQVIVLVPESAVARVRTGQRVSISVPADHIKDVPGLVSSIQNNPTPTSAGVFYQTVVNITGHAAIVPLNGMTADIEFGS